MERNEYSCRLRNVLSPLRRSKNDARGAPSCSSTSTMDILISEQSTASGCPERQSLLMHRHQMALSTFRTHGEHRNRKLSQSTGSSFKLITTTAFRAKRKFLFRSLRQQRSRLNFGTNQYVVAPIQLTENAANSFWFTSPISLCATALLLADGDIENIESAAKTRSPFSLADEMERCVEISKRTFSFHWIAV